jgi:hypothetical protein
MLSRASLQHNRCVNPGHLLKDPKLLFPHYSTWAQVFQLVHLHIGNIIIINCKSNLYCKRFFLISEVSPSRNDEYHPHISTPTATWKHFRTWAINHIAN